MRSSTFALAALLLTPACGGGGGGTGGGGGGGPEIEAYIKAPNTAEFLQLGRSVAISGDTLVVGAPDESGSGTDVDAPFDQDKAGAGAAYVYVRTGGVWSLQAYLKASNSGEGDGFGWSVAISGDRIVVGAVGEDGSGVGVDPADDETQSGAGAAYVFVRVGGLWSEEARLKASNSGSGDAFGYRVAISGDTVVVGAPSEAGSGSGVDPLPDDLAQNAGAAYVFVRTMAGWVPQATLKSFDAAALERFGSSVAIDGNTIVVGSTNDGFVDTGDPMTDIQGNGAAFVYVRPAGVWSTYAKLVAPNGDPGDQLGDSVGVSGDTIVVGANGEDGSGTTVNAPDDDAQIERGAAYVFVFSAGTWTLQAYLKPSTPTPGVQFGIAAAISGDTVVVGTPNQNVLHLFARTGSSWAAAGTLTAPAPGSVGSSVGIDGDTVVAGAPTDSGSGTGINPPHDLLLEWSGAAYVGR